MSVSLLASLLIQSHFTSWKLNIFKPECLVFCFQLQLMEGKMRELQEQLLLKMREINSARDAQVSLKAEIESYRVLLEEEENR